MIKKLYTATSHFIFATILSLIIGFLYFQSLPEPSELTFLNSNVTLTSAANSPNSVLIESEVNLKRRITFEAIYSLKSVNKPEEGVIHFPGTAKNQVFSNGKNTIIDELKLPPSLPHGKYQLIGDLIVTFSPIREETFHIVDKEIVL